MRLAAAILTVTIGTAGAVWLHGLRHTVPEQVPDPTAPGLLPTYTVVRFSRRYRWDDEAAIGALGVGLAAAVLVGRTKAAPAC